MDQFHFEQRGDHREMGHWTAEVIPPNDIRIKIALNFRVDHCCPLATSAITVASPAGEPANRGIYGLMISDDCSSSTLAFSWDM
jgi:hypothetical protein